MQAMIKTFKYLKIRKYINEKNWNLILYNLKL